MSLATRDSPSVRYGHARHSGQTLDRRVNKRPKYQSMGAVYWIVDTDARVVEAWLPSAEQPRIHSERVEWRPEGAPRALVLDIVSFFKKVFREHRVAEA